MSSDGLRVAVGAYREDSEDPGHVRVYDWNPMTTTWTPLGSVIDGEDADDRFGYSVAMSSGGARIAIGAIYHGDDGAGHVRVYDWNPTTTTWTQVGSNIDGEAADDQLGRSVAISGNGNHVAIGAFLDDGSGVDAGHVRVYALG